MSKLWLWIFALVSLAAAAPLRSETVVIGAFCLEGVAGKDLPGERAITNDGTVEFSRFSKAVGTPAKIVVFSKFVKPDSSQIPTCAETKSLAAQQGVPVLLEGSVVTLQLKLGRVATPGRNSLIVRPKEFNVTIGRVTSGLGKVAGGTLDLAGSQAWISNASRINVDPEGMRGVLRLESWNRTIRAANVKFAGGTSVAVDLKQSPDENITVDVDTADGSTRLFNARLRSAPKAVTFPALTGEVFQATNAAISTDAVIVLANSGEASAGLDKSSGHADEARFGANLYGKASSPVLKWRSATGRAVQSAAELDVEPLAFRDFSLQSTQGEIGTATASVISGQVASTFTNLGAQAVNGGMHFGSPRAPAAQLFIPDGALNSANVRFAGAAASMRTTGNLDTKSIEIGNMLFDVPALLNFSSSASGHQLEIPIHIHAPKISGSFTVHDDDQRARVAATLKTLNLDGLLLVDLTDPKNSELRFPRLGVKFDLASTVASQPILAGIAPTFAVVGVSATNNETIKLALQEKAGSIDIQTPVLVVGEPIIKFGNNAKSGKFALQLKSAGAAKVRYDLSKNAFRLAAAHFDINDVHARPLTSNTVVDIGDFDVTDPTLSIKSASLDLKEGDATGSLKGSQFELAAANVSRGQAKSTDVGINGALSPPFTIETIAGVFAVDDKEVKLTDLDLNMAALGVRSAHLLLGESAQLQNSNVTVSAKRVQSLQATDTRPADQAGTFFSDLHLRADGELSIAGSVELDNNPKITGLDVLLNGRSDTLTGTGAAHLGGFSGKLHTDIDTGFECSDGNHLKIPMSGRLATGASDLDIQASNGDISADGSFDTFSIVLTWTGDTQCDSKVLDWKIDPVWVEASFPCPFHPWDTCHGKTKITPELHIPYKMRAHFYSLTVTGVFADPIIRFAKKSSFVCNRGPVLIGPSYVLGGIVPQLPDNGVIAQLINAHVEAFGTAIESGIGTTAINVLGSPAGNIVGAYCIFKEAFQLKEEL